MLISLFCVMFWSFSLVFFLCEFGENISGEFDELNGVIYQCNWHLCPIEVQNKLPIILISTQDPIILSGFGNVRSIQIGKLTRRNLCFSAEIEMILIKLNPFQGCRRWIRIFYDTA